jgi:hypothetical protein
MYSLCERGSVQKEKVIFYFPSGKEEKKYTSVSIASKMLARLAFSQKKK